jgi:hypothetical protein
VNRIGFFSLRSEDPYTCESLPKAFTPLRGVRPFHSFAFESKLSTLRNKKASSTTSKRLCEPDWIRTNGLLLRRQLLYPTELPVRIRAKIRVFRFVAKVWVL